MLRVVKMTTGVALDPRQILPGRGAYVHVATDCMERAIKRGGLAHTLRSPVPNGLLTGAAAKAPSVCDIPRGSKDS
jgi:predicted RNA-binding protein YlxR (DUF448 family)